MSLVEYPFSYSFALLFVLVLLLSFTQNNSSKQSPKVLTFISSLLLYFAVTHTLTSINISHTLYLPFRDLCLNLHLCFLPSADELHLAPVSFCFLCFHFTLARRRFTCVFVSDLFWFRSWARSLAFSVCNVIKKNYLQAHSF